MVTNEEISRMLDAKRRGINIKKVKTSTLNYKRCPSCKSKNPEAATFCVQCGKKLDIKSTVKCSSCGAENSKNAKFCVECGETLNKIPDASNKIKKSETEVTIDTLEKETPSSEPKEEVDLNTKIDANESEIENPDESDISNDNSEDIDKPLIKPIPSIKIPSSVPEHQIINQQNSKKICSSCQSKNLKNAKFCVVCGEKFVNTAHEKNTDKKEDKLEPITESSSTNQSYDESMDKSENNDPIEKIKKAKELLDIGAITEEEFESIKTKYLQMI